MARERSETKPRGRKVRLLPQGPHARYGDACARLAVALVKAGKDVSNFGRPRQQVYWDLRDPIHEYALGRLYEWWDYDQPKLLKHGGRSEGAKPRIVLKAFLTRPGNLSVEWMPDERSGSDWTRFHRLSGYGPYRPSNELMFFRGLRALNPNPKPDDFFGEIHDPVVDAHLLACVGAAISELERRLQVSFKVRWESKFALDWAPEKKGAWTPHSNGHPLLGWHIEDIVAQVRREEAEELALLLELTQHHAAGFVQLLVAIEPSLTLEELRSDVAHVRLQKKLRKLGITITPAPLGRLVKLLEDHHADLLRPLWRTVGGGALQVVK